MHRFDESFRTWLVERLARRPTGREVVRETAARIEGAGYQVRHTMYPFGILGHRLERVRTWDRFAVGRPFELPTYGLHLAQLARGVMPLLNRFDRQPLEGVWAIQPHVANERLSGLNASQSILSVWPPSTMGLAAGSSAVRSQSRVLLSQHPVAAQWPSGLKKGPTTLSLCPGKSIIASVRLSADRS